MSLNDLRYAWYADLYRHEGRTGARFLLKHLLLSPGYTFMFYFRLCTYLRCKQPALLALPLYCLARIALRHYSYRFGIFIPFGTQVGDGFYIGHCGDIHCHALARIGKNCNISQGVTLGQASRGKNKGHPSVGDGVYIGPGAKLVGAVRVGANAAIGANCVVTKDVPPNAVVVGVPGHVISYAGAAEYVIFTDYAPRCCSKR